MPEKPTYEELKQQIKELEKESIILKETAAALKARGKTLFGRHNCPEKG